MAASRSERRPYIELESSPSSPSDPTGGVSSISFGRVSRAPSLLDVRPTSQAHATPFGEEGPPIPILINTSEGARALAPGAEREVAQMVLEAARASLTEEERGRWARGGSFDYRGGEKPHFIFYLRNSDGSLEPRIVFFSEGLPLPREQVREASGGKSYSIPRGGDEENPYTEIRTELFNAGGPFRYHERAYIPSPREEGADPTPLRKGFRDFFSEVIALHKPFWPEDMRSETAEAQRKRAERRQQLEAQEDGGIHRLFDGKKRPSVGAGEASGSLAPSDEVAPSDEEDEAPAASPSGSASSSTAPLSGRSTPPLGPGSAPAEGSRLSRKTPRHDPSAAAPARPSRTLNPAFPAEEDEDREEDGEGERV